MIISSNIILYCKNWKECIQFYRDTIGLKIHIEKDWFVEFRLNDGSFVSIADEARATVKSSRGMGITLSFKVLSLSKACDDLAAKGVKTIIKKHPWGGEYIFINDPEENRIELWSE